MVDLRYATWGDHADVTRLARKVGPFVATFHDVRNVRAAYDGGQIIVASPCEQPTLLAGFCYFKHLKVKPYTSIYELGVDPEWRRDGIGATLLNVALAQSPHDRARLVVDARNESGRRFWARQGFRAVADGFNKRGEPLIYMEMTWS